MDFPGQPEILQRKRGRALDRRADLPGSPVRKEIKIGDRVYLWECGPRGGIIGLAEVAETPRIQAEPIEQLPFIRESEKFAGDQLRVKLRMVKRIEPVILRKYLLSRPELASLSILRCARGTNFRVTHEQAAALQQSTGGI